MNELYSSSAVRKWQRGDGWCGVVPGKTSIKDAINRLGGSCEMSEMANGFSFDFKQGLIRVTTIEQQGVVSKIWISGELAREASIPATISEAKSAFSNLLRVRHYVGTEIYECDGLRLAAAAGNENGIIAWIEFF